MRTALRAADVVVVVSGLDGIAPIVAGLVDSPVVSKADSQHCLLSGHNAEPCSPVSLVGHTAN